MLQHLFKPIVPEWGRTINFLINLFIILPLTILFVIFFQTIKIVNWLRNYKRN